MKIIRGFKRARIRRPTVITIGIFDGVHIGHKKILALVRKRAKELNVASCIVTFDPHPAEVLHPDRRVPLLVSTEHKLKLLAEEGIDYAVLIHFSERFAQYTGPAFVKSVLVDRLNVKELYVGENFSFGKGRRTSIKRLRKIGKQLDFKVHAVRQAKRNGLVASSTLVRSLVLKGDLKTAAALLGRRVSILGTVTRGSKRGRILGFPTANLDLHHEAVPPSGVDLHHEAVPPSGVYIVKVKHKKTLLNGILNIGFRPTFDRFLYDKEPTVEVHIFDFDRDIYREDLEVIFIKRIRSEHRFRNKEHLLDRIAEDVRIAGMYFAKNTKF
jgi:riboflavin kinase/FMN adenylyltransferase